MNKVKFLENEGNNYFKRNQTHLGNSETDIILKKIDIEKHNNKIILEIGCSNGWRLNELNKKNTNNTYIGLEPSLEAINDGKKKFKDINFIHGTMDKIELDDSSCDIILIPFVLMYIDRKLLFKCIYEIDRVLKDKGILIITDFYPNFQCKNIYKHLDETYIYKQSYFNIFISSRNYFLYNLECFTHNTSLENYYQNTCFYSELHKDLENIF